LAGSPFTNQVKICKKKKKSNFWERQQELKTARKRASEWIREKLAVAFQFAFPSADNADYGHTKG
jgi:hypothetical protein